MLLVLGVLGDEDRKGVVDAALRQELLELVLDRDVERVELPPPSSAPFCPTKLQA